MSGKRLRACSDDRDSVITEARNQIKRRRPTAPENSSHPPSDGASNTQSESESDVSLDEEDGRNSARGESDTSPDEDNPAYLAWATQQVEKDFHEAEKSVNKPSDSGIIEEIECINFMCHEHLKVTLGPLINFIVGHNGSGKSAILTALTICLGGKATATNRAQNLKSLIKEGKDYSLLTVRIKNQGPLAFKPMQYGTSLIIERHISRCGASTFKTRDQNNRIVSTKKAEMEDILDAFSMQIDNPMNVLTQDMARQFLNQSTPKDKYKFFLQGTQLEALSRDYEQIEQSLETMNGMAEVKKADLNVLREQMEDLAGRARRAQRLEDWRAEEKELVDQVAWSRVEQDEQIAKETDIEMERLEGVIADRMHAVEQASALYSQADEAHQAAQHSVKSIATDLETARQQIQEANEDWKELKDKLLTLRSDERKFGEDVTTKKNAVKKYESDIVQYRERQEEADNGLYAEKVRELEGVKEQCEHAKTDFSSHDAALPALEEDFSLARTEQTLSEQKLSQARGFESRIRNNLRSLQEGQANWVDAYPRPAALQSLLRAIRSERRFRENPVGPLGRHVRLLRPDWGYILEKQFGSVLNGFVVTSKADQGLLIDLMRKSGWSSPIYIGSKTHIDTTPNEPDSQLLTWSKALKIDDDLVRNQFIINQRIEQTVLIDDRAKGLAFMGNRGRPTRNVKMCFTFADGDKRRGRVINFTPNGGINDSPIGEYEGSLRMLVDKEDQIREEQVRLENAQRDVCDAEQAAATSRNRVNACKSRQMNHQRQKRALQLKMQEAQDKADRLEGELSDATPDAAAIEVLEDSLEGAREEYNHAEGIYEDLVLQKHKISTETNVAFEKLQGAQQVVQELEFKLSKVQSIVRKLQGQREDELKKKNNAIARVEAAEENKTTWTTFVNASRHEMEVSTRDARFICPQRVAVPKDKSPEQLYDMLCKLRETRLESEKALGGDQEHLLGLATKAKRAHETGTKESEGVTDLCSHLTSCLFLRRHRWDRFRNGISTRARVTFNYLLSERKFRGTIIINHTKGLLDIHVQPDITERSGDGRQTKTLSGGEKSFSTVCLLLSLWDAMGSPIRCLDEFDVFMDSVNRDRSMHMIIHAAQRSYGRQFIFITPQSMNSVRDMSDVKVIKMSDPERGQTTLRMDRE